MAILSYDTVMFIGLLIPTIPEIRYASSKPKSFGVQIKLDYIEATDNTSCRKTTKKYCCKFCPK